MIVRRYFLTFLASSTVLFCCLLVVIGSQNVVAQSGEDALQEQVFACSALPSQEEIDQCYAGVCSDGATAACAESIVGVFAQFDTEFAMAVLEQLSQNAYFTLNQGEEYRLAYVIGSRAFQSADADRLGNVFLACTPEFYRECYYGFVEAFVSANTSTVERAVTTICGTVSESVEREECYQVMGRVSMKYANYVFDKALSVCDTTADLPMRERCYDGVFIEHSDTFFESNMVRYGGFLKTDALAPCTVVDKQYQRACYTSHGRYLHYFSEGRSLDPADACSRAGEYEAVCRQSVAGATVGSDSQSFDIAMSDTGNALSDFTTRSWWQRVVDFILGFFFGS